MLARQSNQLKDLIKDFEAKFPSQTYDSELLGEKKGNLYFTHIHGHILL